MFLGYFTFYFSPLPFLVSFVVYISAFTVCKSQGAEIKILIQFPGIFAMIIVVLWMKDDTIDIVEFGVFLICSSLTCCEISA